MPVLRETPNTRVFIVENTNYTFKNRTASIPRYEQFIGVADVQLNYSDRSPGLNLGNVTYVERPDLTPVPYGKNLTEYEISGVPTNSLNQGFNFYRSRVSVTIPGIPNQYSFFDTLARRFLGFARYPTWAPEYWKSPHFPVNTWFWWCVVSQAPQVLPNQVISIFRGFSLNYPILLIDPLLRIPESVSANGLPAGLQLSFNTTPAAILDSTGKHVPEEFLPEISGIATQEGAYTANITVSNPHGSTTTPITIQVIPPPSRLFAVGAVGADALYLGDKSVSSAHIGSIQVYP